MLQQHERKLDHERRAKCAAELLAEIIKARAGRNEANGFDTIQITWKHGWIELVSHNQGTTYK